MNTTIFNVTTSEFAKKIINVLRYMTNVDVDLHYEKNIDRKGVGQYRISYQKNTQSHISYDLMNNLAKDAMILVLADRLRELEPNSPLIKEWMMLPENRKNLAKYNPK